MQRISSEIIPVTSIINSVLSIGHVSTFSDSIRCEWVIASPFQLCSPDVLCSADQPPLRYIYKFLGMVKLCNNVGFTDMHACRNDDDHHHTHNLNGI